MNDKKSLVPAKVPQNQIVTVRHVDIQAELNPATGLYEIPLESGSNRTIQSPVIWGVFLTLVVGFTWAGFAEIDQVTRGSGSIIASQKTQVVQSPDGGVIEDLLVKEGDEVKANQILAKLDQGKVGASLGEVIAKQYSLQAAIVRLNAEILETPIKFPEGLQAYPEIIEAQTRLYQRRKQALNEETGSLAKSLRLAEEELSLNENLLATGDVSRTEVIRLRRQANDLQSQISNKRNKFFQDAQTELAKAEDELASVSQTVNQRQAALAYTNLTAPVSGVVRNVRFTTKGAVLRAGDELLTIVPTADSLIVEAKVRPADIAFIKKGMPANIKIDAYDYAVFGTLNGEVIYISADTLTDENAKAGTENATYYRVHVETKDRTFKKRPNETLELIPGMTSTVEIKTGKNNVLRYLFKPLIKTVDQSFGER